MTTILMNYVSIAMNYFNNKFKTKWPLKYLEGEEGIVAIEYVLIAALIAIAIIGGATLLGTNLNSFFDSVASFISGHEPPPTP
jgi:pilus assembly protein Flp/PilA